MAALMPEQDSSSQTRSELASFGDELRKEREIRGISLKEIADSTKISKRFLEAIERNDHGTLPAPVFTRGFVREYARYLGLNHEDMVNRYNFAAAGDERVEGLQHPVPQEMPQHPREIAGPRPKKGIPPAIARVDRSIFLTIAIVVALAGLTWWAVQYKRAERARIARNEAAAPAVITPPKPAPTATQPDETAATSGMLRLGVEALADSWVELDVDGKTVLKDELKKGDRRTFEARESFRFRKIGNAAGLGLTFNDIRLPALGGDGKVVNDYVLDREDLTQPEAGDARSDT
jgi:cytoskeletal protein RodZ